MRKLLLDLPSDDPALGFGDAATAIARVISQSNPQFAIGIFGGWGSGKTTLMQAIEARLDRERIVSVRFSAWRYEKEEHLIVPLLDTIREALLVWSEHRPEVSAQARKTAKTIGRVMRSILAGMSMNVGVPGAIDISFDANKALSEHRTRFRADYEADIPRSAYHASFRALQSTFDAFVHDGRAADRRLVVFVDDLDRCLPENALQVLESMKLFFDLPGFVFVVGLDQAVVEHVIDAKYSAPPAVGAENHPGARISGAEYIKKIFQLPYRLTPVAIDQLEEFLETAYREADLTPEQRAELNSSVTPHLRWVVGDGSVNPREIKRYINAYTLLIEVGAPLNHAAVLTLQTIAFRSDWSRVQDALLEYQDVFVDALRRRSAEWNALVDLDPELQAIPDDFLEYVAPDAPGEVLLNVGPLAPYLSSGESVRSTQNPALLDSLRAAGSVRRILRQAAGGATPLSTVVPDIIKTLSRVEGPLITAVSGPLRDAVLAGVQELRTALEPYGPTTPNAPPPAQADDTFISEHLEPLARDLARRLLRMYRQGDVLSSRPQPSTPAPASTPPLAQTAPPQMPSPTQVPTPT